MQETQAPQPLLPESNRRLLRSFPDIQVQTGGLEVLDALVQGAICEVMDLRGVAALLTSGDVLKQIVAAAGLEYDQSEVIASLERLERNGLLTFKDPSHRAFVFSDTRYFELKAAVAAREAVTERVESEWKEGLAERHGLDGDAASQLWAALERFIAALVHDRAEEAAAFLYMTDQMGQVRFYSVLQGSLPVIEDLVSEDLAPLAREEIIRFFDPSNRLCVDYLADRLHAAFYFHLLNLDPSAAQLVRGKISNKTLYLDTNVLYRLLGLHGPALAFAPAKAVEVSKQLGCRLVVAQETINEFIRSLRSEVNKIRLVPLKRDTYARLAAEHPSDDLEFMQAFYRELNSGRISTADEFERKYSNVKVFLDEWGVELDEVVGTDQDRSDPSYQELFSELNNWHRMEKPLESIDHDVVLLRHIDRLRGSVPQVAGDVRYWLLTYDRRLTVFAVHQATDERLPSCMLLDDWMQITRPFLPRTPEYESAFVAMLRHPLLLQQSRKAVPFEHVVGALNRLERYRELPPKVVAAMVADTEFVRRLRAARSEQDEKNLIELQVERASRKIAEENEELRRRLQHSDERVVRLEDSVRQLRKDKANAELSARSAAGEAQAAQVASREAAMLYEQKVAEIVTDLSRQIERQRADADASLQALKSKIVRAGASLAGAALIIGIVTWVVLVPLRAAGGVKQTVVIGWGLVALGALLGWAMKARIVSIVLFAITILGALGLSYQLWLG